MKSVPDVSASIDAFWKSLSETIAWSRSRIDVARPAECLRTPETRPRLFTSGHFDTVEEALRHRYPRPTEVPAARDLVGGKLLVYFPDLELADGAAEAESRGYLDVNNAPPWDTWVALVDDQRDMYHPFLIAWVPPEFVDLASAGIRVNPEECVQWLDDADLHFKRLLG